MAGAVSEARFAGLSLMQLHELLEDDAQLGDMVRGMEEVSVLGPGKGGAGRRAGSQSGALTRDSGAPRAPGRFESWIGVLNRDTGSLGPGLGSGEGVKALRLAW